MPSARQMPRSCQKPSAIIGKASPPRPTPHTADGQVKLAARRFGLAAAAGEMAITLEILPWPDEDDLPPLTRSNF